MPSVTNWKKRILYELPSICASCIMALRRHCQRKMEHNGLYTHKPTGHSLTFTKENGIGPYRVYSYVYYCVDWIKPLLLVQKNKSSIKCSETVTTVKPRIG